MTNEEIKNLLPPQMRVINTTAENGEALLRGETVMDSAGNEVTMGFNDVVAVPDDTDEKIAELENKISSKKYYKHTISVDVAMYGDIVDTIEFSFINSDSTQITDYKKVPFGRYNAIVWGGSNGTIVVEIYPTDMEDGEGNIVYGVDWYVYGCVLTPDFIPAGYDGCPWVYENTTFTDTVTEL